MREDEMVQLLREIRDLQQQHVLNYKDALANQEKSIAIQTAQAKRARIVLLCVALLFVSILVALLWPHK